MSSKKLCNRGVGENNLIIVHPFYCETDDTLGRNAKTLALIEYYKERIETLIREINREKFRVVLNDTRLDFLEGTRRWLDAGLLDAVYLDHSYSFAGCEIPPEAFRYSEQNFVAGSYGGGRCVSNVMGRIKTPGKAPFCSLTLVQDAILYRNRFDRCLCLEQVFHTFGKTIEVSDLIQQD